MAQIPPRSSDSDLVRDRLRARAQRVRTIRRRVTAAALATFALAFGVIAGTGSLGATSAASTSAQTNATGSTSTPTTTATTTSSQKSSGTSAAQQSSGGASAVTTSQS